MRIGVPKEIWAGEKRVATTPDAAKKLIQMGYSVAIEASAGSLAGYSDAAYQAVGCTVCRSPQELFGNSDVVIKVRQPIVNSEYNVSEVSWLNSGSVLISFCYPAQNKELLDALVAKNVSTLAMDCVPRISRAQKMDALSSMANIAGYRAVIEAAHHFGRFFTGQITAAGKVPPAKVLIIGAGVAGLAAIGAARALGGIVRAFDTRLATKDQIKSLGAEFLELKFAEDGSGEGGYAKVMSPEFIRAEMELFAQQAKDVDIIITTALVPGVKAPTLITREMVESMRAGSVIVDLAAEQGGNCEVTEHGKAIRHGDVTVLGYSDLPSRLAGTASQLYATNIVHLVSELGATAAAFRINTDDEVIRGALVTHAGAVTWPPPKVTTATSAPTAPLQPKASVAPQNNVVKAASPNVTSTKNVGSHGGGHHAPSGASKHGPFVVALGIVVLFALGAVAPVTFLSQLLVFILACFVGYYLVWNVSASLHTPLMSVTNAISGIIIVGGMLQLKHDWSDPQSLLGAIAILVATINIAGGFLVTQRMLRMFRK